MIRKLNAPKEVFENLQNGQATLDVRAGFRNVKQIKVGETISYSGYETNEFRVVRIAEYSDLDSMLEYEAPDKILPGKSLGKVKNWLHYHIKPEDEELGIFVFELVNIADTVRIFQVSNLVKTKSLLFARLISEAYRLTDWYNRKNDGYLQVYWSTYVPGVLLSQYEIFVACVGRKIAGVLIVHHDHAEYATRMAYTDETFAHFNLHGPLCAAASEWLGEPLSIDIFRKYRP